MKLSIITLAYNNLNELKATLDSIPEENFVESIIVNGGNSPYSADLIKSRNGKIINEKDEGIADAFNKGVKASNGDLIMFLNSGDILINRNYLTQAINLFEEKLRISFVHSNILYSDAIGGDLIVKPPLKNLGRGMKYLHPSMIVKKEVFNELGYFNLNYRLAMDFDFVVKMEKKGLKGLYLDIAPVVKMSGEGRSHLEEFSAIKECIRSLRENEYLTIKNLIGLVIRVFLFVFRKIILFLGGKKLLRFLKRLKYNSQVAGKSSFD
jgi:glycosyltransferase